LQKDCSLRYAAAVGSQHRCQEIVGHPDKTVLNTILHHEQPTSQTLLNFMQPIAGSRLGDLHPIHDGKATELQQNIRELTNSWLNIWAGNAMRRSSDLNNLSQRASLHSN